MHKQRFAVIVFTDPYYIALHSAAHYYFDPSAHENKHRSPISLSDTISLHPFLYILSCFKADFLDQAGNKRQKFAFYDGVTPIDEGYFFLNYASVAVISQACQRECSIKQATINHAMEHLMLHEFDSDNATIQHRISET